jgi:hypothetical protein
MPIIEFGEWLPDLPDFMNPGATVAQNVIPAGASYQSFPSQTVFSSALTARCQGAISTKDQDGNTALFAGDATKLYKNTSSSYNDVSLVGGYNTSTEEAWHFARFGNRVIATNFADNPQTWTLGSSSAFANLTTALKARYVCKVRNFLMFGNTFDGSDGNVPHRVRWSGIGDPTDFTVSASTQSDFNDLDSEFGWVRQVVGGEYGVVFQERAISRMTYAGSPTIWQFDQVESSKGTQSPYGVVRVGNLIFYPGIDGFYAFNGSESVPIGANKIDKTFLSDMDLNYLTRIYGAVDLDQQIIYWLYPGSGNSSGRGNKILCYNYSPSAGKRWTQITDLDLELLFNSVSIGYTLDELDAFGTMETLPYSLDSRVWTGGNFLLSGFDSNHKQVNFTGSAMTALIETQEAQITPGRRTNVRRIRPIVDGSGTTTIQMGTRNLLSESVSYASAASVNSNGDCPVRSNARYHRARVNISGGFNDAQGIDLLEFESVGTR